MTCRPIRSIIILVIKQILRPRILLITRMITDRIGLHSVLLPLLITNSTRKSASHSALHFPIRTKKIIWMVEPC